MREIFLLKYGELALKGLNRNSFEDVLLRNIRHRLKHIGNFEYALQLIEEMDFPERLIAGTDYDKLSSFLNIGKK